ncbi:6049_t:CDS:2 [Gigaspora margarita]|uniref:6049_t:CDS:1 n=1 Tax=Gigaspora margarita TaxID=4874 RepID=A0ABN7V4J3_GIGMA|nr:6049_t:CDS:2 [Gigaspora margarita]
MVQKLSDKDTLSANSLISLMRYSKGPNEGNIISSYLQHKMYNYFTQSYYKHKSDYHSLQNSNLQLEKNNKTLNQKNQTLIKQTQSLGAQTQYLKIQKSKHISEIRSLVRYSKQLIGQMSLQSTVECMNLDVSELFYNKQIYQAADVPVFGVMFWNKSEQAPVVIVSELKNILRCNAKTVSDSVIENIKMNRLEINKYAL